MTISARAYCHDEKGQLMVYEVTGLNTFEEMIDAVKQEIGAKRVLCSVSKANKANPPLEQDKEEAA